MKSSWLAKVITRLLSSLGTGKRYLDMLRKISNFEEIKRFYASFLLENARHSLAELSFHIMKYQVRVLLGHWAYIGYIVAHNHIRHVEIRSWTIW